METSGIFALLLAITVPDLAKSVGYQPIKITVNENFNGLPGAPHAHGLPAIGPSYVHQGANFFFNPQLQFPVGLMPPHIEALVSAVHKNESIIIENKPGIAFEDEVITEILKPLIPLPVNCIDEKIEEDIKITEIVVPKPAEVLPILPVPKPIEVLPILPVPKPVEVIVEEHFNQPPLLLPGGMPEPPTLPPPTIHVIPPVISEDVIIEEPSEVVLPCAVEVNENPVLLDESVAVLPPVPMIPMQPVLSPIVVPEIHEPFVIEEVLEPKPCVEEIAIEEENIVPMVISKPQKVILGILDAVPVVNQFPSFGTIVEEIKPQGFDTYYDLPVFKPKHKVRKSLVPFPNLDIVLRPNLQEDNRFEYSTYCARGIVAERIAPNIMMRGQSPKLLKLMSTRPAH